MDNVKGVVYILTNPSFPEWIKIGYSDDVKERLKKLNRSECIPFSFRLYAYLPVPIRLEDKEIHDFIDLINPDIRSVETTDGKQRKREFYHMSPQKGYDILKFFAKAKFYGIQDQVILVQPTRGEQREENVAETERTSRKKMPRLDWMIDQGLVKAGDRIYVVSQPEKKATIIDGKTVEFEGERMSMNTFGTRVTGWQSIQSYTYMILDDGRNRTLGQIREERVGELEHKQSADRN